MKSFFSLFLIGLFITGCSTMDVNVDYDTTFDFNKVSKVAVVHEHKASDNNLLNDRVINALTSNLESKRYVKVIPQEAELLFVFHTNVKDKTQVNTDYITMGMRFRGGGMIATTSTYEYTEGTLVIDALNPKTKKIVWRGIGTKEISDNLSPEKRVQSINKAVNSIMEKFPSN